MELTGVLVPPGCACCGAEAGQSDALRVPGQEAGLIVGYCADCRAHQGVERTRRLAGGLAAGLVGLALGLVLPLSSRPLAGWAFAGLACAGALLPVLVVAAWPRRAPAGHAAFGPAVRFVAGGELLCADDRWAVELARMNGAGRRLARWRELRLSRAMLIGPLLAPPLALLASNVASPIVRVVNLSGDRLALELDGHPLRTLEPTSVESPSAGAELRIPVGLHELVARAPDGRVLERASVTVESGRVHLFAPASDGYCFWLETVRYGRETEPPGEREPPGETEPPSEREPLLGPPHFWVLPEELGGWFAAPPEEGLAEKRSTGGSVTVLRQAPCAVSP